MAKEKGYNGWTNYETWNVALWMDNERGSHDYWIERAQEVWGNSKAEKPFSREERAIFDLSDMLESEFEDAQADFLERAEASSSMWADLVGSALSEVNWREIAKNLLENVEKKK